MPVGNPQCVIQRPEQHTADMCEDAVTDAGGELLEFATSSGRKFVTA